MADTMMNFSLIACLVSACWFSTFAKSIEVFVKNSAFYSPQDGPYIETDILITGNSINYRENDNGKFSGAIEITLLFKQGAAIVNYDKYTLRSVEIEDTLSVMMSLIDKKRFPLPAGAYTLEASFKDLYNEEAAPFSYTEPLIVDDDRQKVILSDIMFIDAYHESNENSIYARNGYHLAPYVINFYPENIDRLIFYAELYNTNQLEDDRCLAVISIKKFKQNNVVGNLHTYQKLPARSVNVLFSEFDISNLMTGNYQLVVEIKNKENQLLAIKQLFFQRYKNLAQLSQEDLAAIFIENTFVEKFSVEELAYHLSSALPIANATESMRIKELVKSKNRMDMARYLFYFWYSRNPVDPRLEWDKYGIEVKKVNDHYATTLEYGFETDRGRVYLQYGPPTEILVAPREPGALPYEIWQYNQFIAGQTNVKFVFYNRDLVSNNYLLIHSNANGEIRNEQWQLVIHEKFSGGENPVISNPRSRDHYGSRTDLFYDRQR